VFASGLGEYRQREEQNEEQNFHPVFIPIKKGSDFLIFSQLQFVMFEKLEIVQVLKRRDLILEFYQGLIDFIFSGPEEHIVLHGSFFIVLTGNFSGRK
jgi:hypothetical protein